MWIKVGKKWDSGAVYAGRGSVFGNPIPISNTHTRDMVCDEYENIFAERMKDPSSPLYKAVHRLIDIISTTEKPITLGCYCTPQRCHVETIQRYVNEKVNERIGQIVG